MAWELARLRDPNETDLLICIPHTGLVRLEWALALKHLDMPPGLSFMTAGNQGQPIHIARNLFVTYALQHKAKFMFFLDSDVQMPNNGIVKLHEARKPVVAGVYCSRAPPYFLSANVNKKALSPELLDQYPDRLVDVHEIGMGCCLIDMRVIKKIASKNKIKWYCMKQHSKELGVMVPPDESSGKEVAVFSNQDAIDLNYKCGYCHASIVADFFKYTVGSGLSVEEGPLSEDYYFCSLARKTGFPISIHTGVFCDHELSHMKLTRKGIYNPVASAVEV